jgi:hypothetical protein
MHENQAAYPSAAGRADPRDAHAAVTNLTSMLAADVVLWNSSWNRASFLEAMEAVLRARTDQADTGMLEEIRSKSSIAWPPVECPTASDPEVLHNASKARARGLTLVAWPHRWEHDKGPDELLRIEHEYGAEARIGWVLLGEQFDRQPPAFRQLLEHAGDRVLHAGTAARGVYETWLVACDWVVSTANHEFFGIAVTEALLAGCMPWLPERLSYPELVPAAFRGYSPMQPPDEPEAMIAAIRAHVSNARAETAVRRIEAAIPHRKDD